MLAVSILIAIAATPSSDGPDRELARSVAAIFDDHRSKFPQGNFVIEHLSGEASSFDEARAGKLSKSHNTPGEYILIPGYGRYTSQYSDDDLLAETKRTSPTQGSVTLTSFRLIHNGKSTLVDRHMPVAEGRGTTHMVSILAGTDEFNRLMFFPLALGCVGSELGDLGRDVRKALAGEGGWSLLEVSDHEKLDGRDVIKIGLKVGGHAPDILGGS